MKAMPKIYHLEQMPWSSAVMFYNDWKRLQRVTVTEKVDGSNLSIGLNNGELYVKTKKGKPTLDPGDFEDLFVKYDEPIFASFNRFTKFCLDHKAQITTLLKNYKIEQLFFEFVPFEQPNVIKYDKARIMGGALYIFDKQMRSHAMISNFNTIFFPWYCIKADPTYVAQDTIDLFIERLGKFMDRHGTEIACRKRDEESLRLKEAAKLRYNGILTSTRDELLCNARNVVSQLGAKRIEGLVVTAGDSGFKVVDLDDFGAERAEKWKSKDVLARIRKEFCTECIEKIFNQSDVLIIKKKQEVLAMDRLEGDSILDAICLDIKEEVGFKRPTELILAFDPIVEKAFESLLREGIDQKFIPIARELLRNFINLQDLITHKLIDHEVSSKNLIAFIIGEGRLEELGNRYP